MIQNDIFKLYFKITKKNTNIGATAFNALTKISPNMPIGVNVGTATPNSAPINIPAEVLKTLLLNIVANPIGSIVNANYIGILAWAVIFGLKLILFHFTSMFFILSLLLLKFIMLKGCTIVYV